MSVLFVRYFHEPTPSRNLVLAEVSRFRVAIHQSLNRPRTRHRVTLEFRQDVFVHLFRGKGRKDGLWWVMEKTDFHDSCFSNSWDYLVDCHGQGTKVHFPVEIRHFISLSPANYIMDGSGNAIPSQKSYLEKMSIDFVKVAA